MPEACLRHDGERGNGRMAAGVERWGLWDYASPMPHTPIHIVGGGLAGSEAAWQVAEAGVPVVLHEMRPARQTEAHKTDGLAELVCSNSFRSDDAGTNAVGLLHEEMRRASSLIMAAGDRHKLPAGGALAVDRDLFSADVTRQLEGASTDPHRARRGGGTAASGMGQRHHRHRPPDLAGVVGRHPAADRAKGSWPSSMPSRRSCTSSPSMRASPGGSRATTRRGRAVREPITSIVR